METFLKKGGLHWGQSRTASGLSRPRMAAKKDLFHLMDVTPQSPARAMQVRDSISLIIEAIRMFHFLHATVLCWQLASIFCIEPTTSRASLNFQEYVLSRPPLSRSHLIFPPLDASSSALGTSSSLLSQPSTSTAPGPFSTGFSLVKEIKDNLSQHEDDNISTTSGFSSRASDKGMCFLLEKKIQEAFIMA